MLALHLTGQKKWLSSASKSVDAVRSMGLTGTPWVYHEQERLLSGYWILQ